MQNCYPVAVLVSSLSGSLPQNSLHLLLHFVLPIMEHSHIYTTNSSSKSRYCESLIAYMHGINTSLGITTLAGAGPSTGRFPKGIRIIQFSRCCILDMFHHVMHAITFSCMAMIFRIFPTWIKMCKWIVSVKFISRLSGFGEIHERIRH